MALKRNIDEVETKKPHNLILEDRKRLSMSGISSVERFDEERVIMYCADGELNIRGNSLKIDKYDVESGDVSIEGVIDLIEYCNNTKPAKGLFGAIFK